MVISQNFLNDVRCIALDYTHTLTPPGRARLDDACTQPVDPAAAAVVHTLHDRGYLLILATNTVRERPRDLALAQAGIAGLFRAVLQSHKIGVRKPDPEFFQKIVDAAGTSREVIMYVGDRPDIDIDAAVAAGLRAALVAPPDGPIRAEQPLPPGAIRLHHITDLPTVLPDSCPSDDPR